MQKKILDNPKVKVMWNTEVTEIAGSTKVEKLLLKNNQTGKTEELAVDGLFVAIGHKPDSNLFKDQINMDEKGFIKPTFGHTGTNIKGVFVAGDVMDAKYKQAITSAGSGCIAAMETLAFLENKG